MAGLLSILSNQQIDARDRAEKAASPVTAAMAAGSPSVTTDPLAPPAAAPEPNQHLVGRLASYVRTCWQAAYDAKQQHETLMLEDIRQRECIYDPAKLADIRRMGGSEIYMALTNIKCRAAKSWIRDVCLPVGERPFAVQPTPVPDLPPDVVDAIAQATIATASELLSMGMQVSPEDMFAAARSRADEMRAQLKQEAQIRNARMEEKIDDLMHEGAWYDAIEQAIGDLVDTVAGILKGPVIRKERTLKWVQNPQSGKWEPQATDELRPMFYAVSPFDFFPAPDSRHVNDGYLFERIPTRRKALYGMIGVPGYSEQNIRAALNDYERGYSLNIASDQQRREVEGSPQWQMSPDQAIDVLEFHGSVKGAWLVEWGMDAGRVPDLEREYEVTAWLVGRFVVRCVLDEDPMGQRPYEMAFYDRPNGSFWGRGIPRLIKDLQAMCNAAARALSNNMGLSSGPFVEVEADRVATGQQITSIHPWMLLQTTSSKTGSPSPAVRFHDIPSNAAELLQVYQHFANYADTYSGIPSYEQGVNPTSGAAGTASGLSMLMNAASRQIKAVIASIDGMTKGCVSRLYTHVMLHDPDESLKGDIKFVPRGTTALLVREQQQIRRGEFLQTVTNPMALQVIGIEGYAALLREIAKGLDIPDVVPNKEEVMAKVQAAMQQEIAAMQAQQQAQQQGKPRQLDAAGNPAGGGAANQFQRRPATAMA